jgi:hypothetical protein
MLLPAVVVVAEEMLVICPTNWLSTKPLVGRNTAAHY